MKKTVAILLAVISIFSLVACGAAPAAETPAPAAPAAPAAEAAPAEAAPEFDELTINWGLTPAPTAGDCESALRLADLIGQYTDGKVQVEVFPSAQLGGEDVMLEGLLSGTVDMANISPNTVASIAPEMNALCLPFLYDSFKAAAASLTSEEYTAKVNEVLEPYGLHYLGVVYVCPRLITWNEDIHLPSETKGQVCRVMGGQIFADTYKAWGLNSTVISWGECYTAMQQHTVDAIDSGNESGMTMAFCEVAKYNLQLDYIYHAQMCLMSTEKWNSFTQDTRDAINKAQSENSAWANQFAYDQWVEDSKDVQGDPYNMINIYLTEEERAAWVEASQPVWEKYKDIIGDEFYTWLTEFAAEKNAQFPYECLA